MIDDRPARARRFRASPKRFIITRTVRKTLSFFALLSAVGTLVVASLGGCDGGSDDDSGSGDGREVAPRPDSTRVEHPEVKEKPKVAKVVVPRAIGLPLDKAKLVLAGRGLRPEGAAPRPIYGECKAAAPHSRVVQQYAQFAAEPGEKVRENSKVFLRVAHHVQAGCALAPSGLRTCAPGDVIVRMGVDRPETAGGGDLTEIAVRAERVTSGPMCALRTVARLTINSPVQSELSKIAANPNTVRLNMGLRLGERMEATWIWSNWCGPDQVQAVASIAGHTVTKEISDGRPGCPFLNPKNADSTLRLATLRRDD